MCYPMRQFKKRANDMFDLFSLSLFANLSPEWAVFFISMIPITELRVSIPVGIEVYGLPIWKVWVLSVLGDMLPAIFILFLVPRLHAWMIRRKFLGKLLTKKMESAEKAFSGKYERYGEVALVVFVGIPLPFTGSWSGSLVAFIFNIPFRKSFPLILAGVCMAATIVTAITLFAGGALRWLL